MGAVDLHPARSKILPSSHTTQFAVRDKKLNLEAKFHASVSAMEKSPVTRLYWHK